MSSAVGVILGSGSNGVSHESYISREDSKGASKSKDDLVFKESGNLPAWAKSPQAFWKASDTLERKIPQTKAQKEAGEPVKRASYREMTLTLPRELSKEENIKLVKDWVSQEMTGHAYSVAIHYSKAKDGGENPHAHLMYSERKQDGVERDKEQFFKRYNAKAPEKGGCQKQWQEGFVGSISDRKDMALAIRERFITLTQTALKASGSVQVIHVQSHKVIPQKRLPMREYQAEKKAKAKAEAKGLDYGKDTPVVSKTSFINRLKMTGVFVERIRKEALQATASRLLDSLKALKEKNRKKAEALAQEREALEAKRQKEEKLKAPWTEADTKAFFERAEKLAQYSEQWGGYEKKKALIEKTKGLMERANYHMERNPDLGRQLSRGVRNIQKSHEKEEEMEIEM